MSYKFSQKLREKTKRYFQKYYSLTISDEIADEYLNSLSDLYLNFNAIEKERTSEKDVSFHFLT